MEMGACLSFGTIEMKVLQSVAAATGPALKRKRLRGKKYKGGKRSPWLLPHLLFLRTFFRVST